jgi:hypothetical protein
VERSEFIFLPKSHEPELCAGVRRVAGKDLATEPFSRSQQLLNPLKIFPAFMELKNVPSQCSQYPDCGPYP